METDPENWSVTQLKKRLEKKSISAQLVLESYLKKIKKKNAEINALISILPENQLYKMASKVDQARARGDKLPTLAGIPIAIKDLTDTKGILTTYGSKIFFQNTPKTDDPMVQNLKKAGLMIIGKTNTPEFGVGSQTFNTIFGATKNPFDLSKTSGGSSGGGAAAVASGMIPFSDGSDMMGSLRNPAAFNNIYGFRPTPSLMPSSDTLLKNFPRLSTIGAMAKSPDDLVLLLQAQYGNIEKTAFSLPKLDLKNGKIKIAWLQDFSGSYPLENGIISMCEKVLGKFDNIGASITPFSPEFKAEDIWDSWVNLRSATIANNMKPHYESPKRRPLLKSEIIWEIERGNSLCRKKIELSLEKQSLWLKYTQLIFDEFDFFALPSTQVFPFDHKIHYPKTINKIKLDTYHRWMEVVVPASLSGLPVASIPCGFNKNGLPTGIQIVGNKYKDKNILALSKYFHEKFN